MRLTGVHLIIVSVLYLVSCGKVAENDSLDSYWIDIATVDSLSPNNYSLRLDNGIKLWPAASNDNIYTPRQLQRVFVNYSILSDKQASYDHFVRINSISGILTKHAIALSADNNNELGHDLIRIKNIWTGGDFLNIGFSFFGDKQDAHEINLVYNQDDIDNSDELRFELRHNAANDFSVNLINSFVSFRLQEFQLQGKDSIKLIINAKESDTGELKSHEVLYRYITKPPTM